jgi:hypothetical protein
VAVSLGDLAREHGADGAVGVADRGRDATASPRSSAGRACSISMRSSTRLETVVLGLAMAARHFALDVAW